MVMELVKTGGIKKLCAENVTTFDEKVSQNVFLKLLLNRPRSVGQINVKKKFR